MANQVKKTDKKIKELVLEYSSSREQLSEEVQASFTEITVDLAKRPETFGADADTDSPNAVPSSVKRHAIEMFHLLKRSREEKDILEKEMKAVFNYFVKEEEKITSSIASLLSEISMTGYEAGAITLLKAERKLLQIRIASIYNNFKDCVNLPDINLPEVPAHERDNVTDSDEDCISFTSEHEELTVSVQSGD